MAIRRSGGAGEDDTMRALARDLGQRGAAQLEASQTRLLTEMGPNGRLITGALILLNGGGIAATALSAASIYPSAIPSAMIFFIFGVALAVIAGLVTAAAAIVMGRIIGEAAGQWTQVAASGETSDAALKAAANVRRKGFAWAVAPLALGLASLLLFMTGAMTVADGLAPSVQTPVTAPGEVANVAEVPDNAANAANGAQPVAANAAPGVAVPQPTVTQQATSRPEPARRAPAARRPVPRPQETAQEAPAASPPPPAAP